MLRQQPRRQGAIAFGLHRYSHQRGHLFGLNEIGLARLAKRLPFQRHDPLIAAAAFRDVEGNRQIAFAEQRGERGIGAQPGQGFPVEFGIPAHRALPVIAYQQADGAGLGLRLHRHLALILVDQAADQRSDDQRLCQQVADRGGVIVRAENFGEGFVQPHEAQARIAIGDGRA